MSFIIIYFLGFITSTCADSYIKDAAKKYSVPEKVLRAVACVESSCGAVDTIRINSNRSIDVGIFQINSVHWKTTCSEYDVLLPKGNAFCAAKLLRKHMLYKAIDPMWPARYHSKTPKYKKRYWNKLNKYL